MGNQLPLYARLFTFLVPVNVAMIYNATLHLVMDIKNHRIVCDEIIFSIKRALRSILKYLIRLRQLQRPLIPAQIHLYPELPYESPTYHYILLWI